MRIEDMAEEIFLGVRSNPIRSGLTMLGIVIGIASVIAMLAIGGGAKAQIESNINALGSNLLIVMPGAPRGAGSFVSAGRGSATTLTMEDADAIKQLSGVQAISPEVSKRFQFTASGKNTNTSVTGVVSAYQTVRNINMEVGSFIADANVTSRSKVIVLGSTVRDDLFGAGSSPIGSRVRVNGIEMTVVGVTLAKGGSGMGNQDDMAFIPLTTMQTFFAGGDMLSTISIQAMDQQSMTTVQSEINSLLLTRHRITDISRADFNVLNQSDLVTAASSVTDTFTMLLASIAGISLLVGGIGIMNMMLTTVTERTKEIGLRQAIGAEPIEITYQFLGEAMLLTIVGGLVGILLGYGIALGVSKFMNMATVVSVSSVLLSFGVSAAIGIVFGWYPARRAASLHPIVALRYE